MERKSVGIFILNNKKELLLQLRDNKKGIDYPGHWGLISGEINAGESEVMVPFLGLVDLGVFYPLILIPLGIVGATTTFNFLAGYNGLEAGLGAIVLSAVAFVAYFTNQSWISVICVLMVASLLAFLLYNYAPAKILPGDSLTYLTGGLIAIVAILGSFEKIALFFFIPFIIEVFLKLRGHLVKESFSIPKKDGSLELRYEKIYSLTHLSIFLMKKLHIKPTEKKVVISIWMFQLVIILLGFIIFKKGIFL